MKRFLALAALASLVLSTSAIAQEETDVYQANPGEAVVEAPVEAKIDPPVTRPAVSKGDKLPELNPSQMSPEMYLYLQEQQRHDDPKQAIRRKAEARTAAREARITAMKWYGMSNARPQANPVPFMGSYSPTWIGGGNDRYDWYGIGWPSLSYRVDQSYQLQR